MFKQVTKEIAALEEELVKAEGVLARRRSRHMTLSNEARRYEGRVAVAREHVAMAEERAADHERMLLRELSFMDEVVDTRFGNMTRRANYKGLLEWATREIDARVAVVAELARVTGPEATLVREELRLVEERLGNKGVLRIRDDILRKVAKEASLRCAWTDAVEDVDEKRKILADLEKHVELLRTSERYVDESRKEVESLQGRLDALLSEAMTTFAERVESNRRAAAERRVKAMVYKEYGGLSLRSHSYNVWKAAGQRVCDK